MNPALNYRIIPKLLREGTLSAIGMEENHQKQGFSKRLMKARAEYHRMRIRYEAEGKSETELKALKNTHDRVMEDIINEFNFEMDVLEAAGRDMCAVQVSLTFDNMAKHAC